jgi:apolipoprotein D and lipocalin family protein
VRRLILAALLSGCAATGPSGYRDASVPIASAALFDAARFAGAWHVVAAYGDDAGCGPLAEDWAATGPGRFRVSGTGCAAGQAAPFATNAAVTGPGRLSLTGEGRNDWVLWVDADYRIAAIGTPDGRFGRIIARTPDARGDLVAAARTALEFNGYDLSRLRPL